MSWYTGGIFKQSLSWLSIDNHLIENSIKVYPNPANDILTIENSTISEVHFNLYDIKGKLILERSLSDKISKIDVRNLKSGMYLTRTTYRNSTEVFKFIKQ